MLDRVGLRENGYIVVQNDSNVSSPSGIVGRTQYVRGGSFEDVILKLNESVGKKATLTVSIHNETSGNEHFDFVNSSGRKDGPVMGPNGKPITDTIQLSKSNNKSSNQTTKTNTSSKSGTNATATPTSRTPTASTSTESPETVTQIATPTPTKTPTTTPRPSTLTASMSGHSQPAKETPNGSVSGAPLGDGGGGPGSGESSGANGFAGLPQTVLLVVGMVVFAMGVMVAFAYFAYDGSDTDQSNEADSTPPVSETEVELTDITHVGGDRADDLREAGYESVADVAEADRDALTDVEGVGPARVERITESADTLLEQQFGATTEGDGEPSVASDVEDERPRATVTFDAPDSDEPDADSEKANEAAHSGRVSVRTLLSSVFASDDADTSSVSEGDGPRSEGTENADGDSSTLDSAVTEVEPEPDDTDTEPTESESPLVRAKPVVTDALAEISGRGRMLIDRRAIDLRAYGVAENWEIIRISVSDSDSAVNRHLLVEIIDLGELEVEVERAATDGGQPTSGGPSRVRISHESVAQLEAAAARGRPEAKRTVTLFRRVLRGCSSGPVVRRFTDDPQEGGNVTVQ